MITYLDCNATTPIEPDVARAIEQYLVKDFGNPGSRTHEYGAIAKSAIENARSQVASVVNANKNDVVFTSGATESNNLALIGLKDYLVANKKSVVSSKIEHKAIIEPLAYLESQGVEVTYLTPSQDGIITTESLKESLSDNVGLVSLMHVNNETGAIQPLQGYADVLSAHSCYFHVDAAQGFGKDLPPLRSSRIDLISCSGHKIYGPKGIGALIIRQRNYKRPPLKPILFGGGQEKGLRPGTLPTHQIVGLGLASELAEKNAARRNQKCEQIKYEAIAAFDMLTPNYICKENSISNTLSISIPFVNSEAAIVALKGLAAISNGSACTSSSYSHSHVLKAMNLDDNIIEGALRFSWCHMTEEIKWKEIVATISRLI
ncbi:aminotransferase class V-fold PLP-dependent enzyme [Teredinibacter turnerae]|uniref:aminotransferase class V-fold PLP-dependent enzyme n=1 Tax=Teredinibacter turnerae TaxID=2426 RepID=UPI00048C1A28|nr:aminotransferase class V-fold PLP-dependent enzyme [Teredinibacter turnerae]